LDSRRVPQKLGGRNTPRDAAIETVSLAVLLTEIFSLWPRRRNGIHRPDAAFRFDDLAGVKAQILAKARRQNLDAGPQMAMMADRHCERSDAKNRHDHRDVNSHPASAPGPPASSRDCAAAPDHPSSARPKRIELHEVEPALQKQVALRSAASTPSQMRIFGAQTTLSIAEKS